MSTNELVKEYIEKKKKSIVYDNQLQFNQIIDILNKFKNIDKNTNILEVGCGTGWLSVSLVKNGYKSQGLEYNKDLVVFARELALQNKIDVKFINANIENADIGSEKFDVIIVSSVFEHVEKWKDGFANIYRALKKDGILYFNSTNKYGFTSGEYNMLMYGWLPNKLRFSIRKRAHGDAIMDWGIDFNQFNYIQLRSFFKQVGFSEIYDVIQIRAKTGLSDDSGMRTLVPSLFSKFPFLRHPYLLFKRGTLFICKK